MASPDRRFMFIFPGQGSQYRGMGSDLHADFAVARQIYDRASETLGFDVAALSFTDPRGELDRTEFTQLALLVHSLACLEVFRHLTRSEIRPYVTAGHSLGEYAALVAAGALDFDDALRIVQARASAMARGGRGRTVALRLGAPIVRSFVDRFYCGIGGCNLPNQTVVGGAEDDLARLVQFACTEHGARAVPLRTEGAFHTYLMIDAAERFRPALRDLDIAPPRCHVLSGYTGRYHSASPETIKAHLFFQIFNPVRWIWALQHSFDDGVDAILEFGGGMGAGSSPSEKVPNLQSITRAALQRAHCGAVYRAAISSGHIQQAADFAIAFATMTNSIEPHGWSGRTTDATTPRSVFLYVPWGTGVRHDGGSRLIQLVAQLGLTGRVQIVAESVEQNVAMLQCLGIADAAGPEPYLELVIAGESSAVLHHAGPEVETALVAFARHDAPPRPAATAPEAGVNRLAAMPASTTAAH